MCVCVYVCYHGEFDAIFADVVVVAVAFVAVVVVFQLLGLLSL